MTTIKKLAIFNNLFINKNRVGKSAIIPDGLRGATKHIDDKLIRTIIRIKDGVGQGDYER